MEDQFERCVIPFMLFGKTGYQIKEYNDADLIDTKVSLGVRRNALNSSAMSTLKSLLPSIVISEDKIEYLHNGVPVVIHIVEKEDYYIYPDIKFWRITEFKIPNPFTLYWEKRGKDD